MGILNRFSTIMESNINALLDKAEDPEKLIEQQIRDVREDLVEVKKETASVKAEENRLFRDIKECNSEIARMTDAAKKALEQGNMDDAKILVENKQSLERKKADLEEAYNASHSTYLQIRKMYDKLNSDYESLVNRKESLKAKLSVAKAQEKVARAKSKIGSRDDSTFERMEDKINKRLDESSAMLELNEDMESISANDIADKYQSSNSSVDAEIEAMKRELGL